MPTYDYVCSKGHTFEVFQRISEKPGAKCPECGGRSTRVISGGAGLIFKGSGFYITDYGKDGKGPRKAEGAEGKAPAGESKDGGSKKSDGADKGGGSDKPKSDKTSSDKKSTGTSKE